MGPEEAACLHGMLKTRRTSLTFRNNVGSPSGFCTNSVASKSKGLDKHPFRPAYASDPLGIGPLLEPIEKACMYKCLDNPKGPRPCQRAQDVLGFRVSILP